MEINAFVKIIKPGHLPDRLEHDIIRINMGDLYRIINQKCEDKYGKNLNVTVDSIDIKPTIRIVL